MGSKERILHLHIGAFKTGSTFLQRALRANGEVLRRQGYLVPLSRRPRQQDHHNLAWEVTGHRRFDPRGFTLERLCRRIEAAPQRRALVSSEFFSLAREQGIRRLLERLDGVELRAVLVIRNQVDAIQALYSESIHHYHFTARPHFVSRQLHDAARFRFDRIYRRWAELLGPERVRVLCYETAAADLLRAFLEACDLELEAATWAQLERPSGVNLSKGLGYLEVRRWHQAALAEERLGHRKLLLLFTDALSRALERDGLGRKSGSYLTQREAALVAGFFSPHNEALRDLLPDLPARYFEPPPLGRVEALPDQEAVARAYVRALDALVDSIPLLRSHLVETALLRLFGSRAQQRADSEEPVYEGGIETLRPRRVAGWLLRSAQPAPLQVRLVVNGESLASVRADLPRRKGRAAGAPLLGHCGFRFALSDRRLCPGDRIAIRDCRRDVEALAAVVPATPARHGRAESAREGSDDPDGPGLHHP